MKKPKQSIDTLFTRDEIHQRVTEMGKTITEDYRSRGIQEVTVLGILKGSFIFMSDLVRAMDMTCRCDFLGVSSYGDATKSSGEVKVTQDLTAPVRDRHVLIVEDIADTGLTLHFLQQFLHNRGVASLKTAVFLSKPTQHKIPCALDYTGFEIGAEFVIGYGLDYADQYRNLPYVGILRTS